MSAEEGCQALDLTFVDPHTGEICQRDVFCDPSDWREQWQTRYLVSTRLINLLAETRATRQIRGRQHRAKLASARLGFLCDIWRLRQQTEQLLQASREELSPTAGDKTSPVEPCPIHYYIPEHYVDEWTQEKLRDLGQMLKARLLQEIRELRDQLFVYGLEGGGNWKELLNIIAGIARTPQEMGASVHEFLQESPLQLRQLQNELTGGLRNELDDLQPLLAEIQVDLEEMKVKTPELTKTLFMQKGQLTHKTRKLTELREKLAPPPKVEEGDTGLSSEAEARAQLAAAQANFLKAQIARILEAAAFDRQTSEEELSAAQARLKDVQDQLEAVKEKETLEETVRELDVEVRALKKSVEAKTNEIDEMQREIAQLEASIAKNQALSEKLSAALAGLPPPDPRIVETATMKRLIKDLMQQSLVLVEKVDKVRTQMLAARMALRTLYKKLEIDWDMSESDSEEMSYAARRRIAQEGAIDWDQSEFLYNDTELRDKKLMRCLSREREELESKLLVQMRAKRHFVRVGPELLKHSDSQPDMVVPFSDDSQKVGKKGVRFDQTAQVDSEQHLQTYQEQLRAIVEGAAQRLPREGMLSASVQRLKGVLSTLGSSSTIRSGSAKLEDLCNELSFLLKEAMDLSMLTSDPGSEEAVDGFQELLSKVKAAQQKFKVAMANGDKPRQSMGKLRRSQTELSLDRGDQGGGRRLTRSTTDLGSMRTLMLDSSRNPSTGNCSETVSAIDFRLDSGSDDPEPWESWPLFKDRVGSSEGIHSDALSGPPFRAPRGSTSSERLVRPGENSTRLLAHAASCDFREYMSLIRQSSEGMWNGTASKPEKTVSRGPSLPQLVRTDTSRALASDRGPGEAPHKMSMWTVASTVRAMVSIGKKGVDGSLR